MLATNFQRSKVNSSHFFLRTVISLLFSPIYSSSLFFSSQSFGGCVLQPFYSLNLFFLLTVCTDHNCTIAYCLYFCQLFDKGNLGNISKNFSIQHIKISMRNILPVFSNIMRRLIGLVGRVFANDPGDLGSIPGRFTPKTLQMVLDTSLLNTQQYKVRMEGKVEQSRELSSALPYTLVL